MQVGKIDTQGLESEVWSLKKSQFLSLKSQV